MKNEIEKLTKKQQLVLIDLLKGLSYSQICKKRNIRSKSTVSRYVKLFEKKDIAVKSKGNFNDFCLTAKGKEELEQWRSVSGGEGGGDLERLRKMVTSRGHGYGVFCPILKRPRGEFGKDLFKVHGCSVPDWSSGRATLRRKVRGTRVVFTPEGAYFYLPHWKDIGSWRHMLRLTRHIDKVCNYLEEEFKGLELGDMQEPWRLDTQEFAFEDHPFGREFEKAGGKFYRDERVTFDNSTGKTEVETHHPVLAGVDADRIKDFTVDLVWGRVDPRATQKRVGELEQAMLELTRNVDNVSRMLGTQIRLLTPKKQEVFKENVGFDGKGYI